MITANCFVEESPFILWTSFSVRQFSVYGRVAGSGAFGLGDFE